MEPSFEPAGPITRSVLALRRLVAVSTAFRRRVGVADEAAAHKKIFLFEYADDDLTELHAARPFATIWPADRLDIEQTAGGARNWMRAGGELVLQLTDRDRYPRDRTLSGLDFAGWIDRVVFDDVRSLAGSNDYLTINHVSFLQTITHNPRADDPAGAYWHCALLVRWGRQ